MDICSVFPIEGTTHSFIQQILIGCILFLSSVVAAGRVKMNKADLTSLGSHRIHSVERYGH